MYDKHLKTFIIVADSGSFLKASVKLYVSANAITKQINLLESDLGIKLFTRSRQGLALTEQGRLIYEEAKNLIHHSEAVIRKAKEMDHQVDYRIRLGVSLMNSGNILLEQWNKASSLYPNLKLEVVPFEDSVPAFDEVLNNLGKTIDTVACPYQTTYWGDRYSSFYLKDLPVRISCSKNHRLASKTKLSVSDLYGETLYMGPRGYGEHMDLLYDELSKHSQIHIQDGVTYDYELFNKLAASDKLAVSFDCWANVHPLLSTIPIDLNYSIPYGLIYAKEPSEQVLKFLLAIGKTK